MNSPDQSRSFIPSLFERLEDRVLFDGVPDAAFLLPVDVAAASQPAQMEFFDQSQSSSPRELIIVDAGVENSQQLLLSLLQSNPETSFEIRHLNQTEDGVEQITDLLRGSNSQYDAIHIVSHGEAGSVALGSSELSHENVDGYADSLASWANALSEDADILFYGCELAGNESGQLLLHTVSNTTGADVAASVDVTGADGQGANWNLEFSSGRIETLALSAENWDGTLMVEATNGAVTIQDAENSGSGTVSLINNAQPESVTVIGTPTRVGQMLERVWTFSETGDVGRSTYVFDVSGVSGFNATIASEFGLIISDQPNLADGPNTTTLVASGYDAANGLVYFHQVDLNDGDFFGLATDVVLDNFSINPTATGLEDTAIDLGLELNPSLIDGGQLQDIIAAEAGFRDSSAGTTSTDFFIPAGTTAIRITGFSTRDIGTGANDALNDDYQFLNASIDLGTETSNGYIGHIIDQGPNRSDQFAFEGAPLGQSVLTGGGTIVGDANDNIDPTFTIVDGVLQITENHQLQTAYHVEFLTNATSSAEFIRTESAVRESGDQTLATLSIPADADFLVVNVTDAQADSNFAIEYKGNSRVYIDLATLRASGVVAAQQGETDNRVVSYAFEDYDVSSASVGSILSAAGTVVGDTGGQATVINDNQIYIDANGDLVIDRNDAFAGDFNSLITVEYYDRRDVGSSAEQLGESSAYGFFESDPSNPISTLEFDIPENAALGIFNLTFNGTANSDTNENSGAAFAVIDLVNEISSGSIYFVRTSNIADLVGFDSVPFGTAFFDDPNSISNHNTINQFNDPFGGTAEFNLINGGTTLQFAANSNSGADQSFRDYFAGAQIEWFGSAPFEITGFTNGGSFSQGTLNPVTGNWELTIAEAQAGLAYIPPTHVSGTIPVDVTLRIGDESEVTSVTVQAVIDPIDFSMAPDACGHEDTDISISANVTPVFVDQDGSETLTSQVLSNVPIGHTLTDGTNTFVSSAGNQSIDITAWDTTAITYRANPDESGTFTITMDVDWQDVGGGVTDTDSLQTTFDVVVKPINDPPVAVNDNYTVLGNTTLTVPLATGLLNNDSDADGDPIVVTAASPLSGPSNGTVTVNANGTFTYTPNTGFSGQDSFEYQISDGQGGFDTATAFIDVSEPVTGPLDAMDDFETTNEETLINIDVMANDDLPTTGAFNIQSTTPPSNGTILVLPDGTIDYTPNTDFFGVDTFTYTLADASGRTSTATVEVTVVNVQDPPVANADSGSTPEDTTLPNIDILNNDSDPDNDTLTVTMATAANGTVVINADGTIDYTPNPNFNGVDIVNYTISDGNGGTANSTVQINVAPVADPPTSADRTVGLNEDSSRAFVPTDFAFADPDVGDSLVTIRIDTLPADGQLLISGNPVMQGDVISLTDISNSQLVFVPDPDGFGSPYTDFDFSVSDGTLFQLMPNTMTINVLPRQDPPVATDNSITVPEDSVGVPLGLAPPTDVDGETLTATVTGLPTLGTVFLADGVTPVNNGDMLTVAQLTSLVYDAPTTFTVAPAGSFTYDVTDGIATDSGEVDITISPENDPPVIDLNNSGAGVDYADTFTEGGAPVGIVDATVEVADDDDVTLPTLKIDVDESTIVDAGAEFLTIGGVDFLLDAATNFTTAITVGGVSYDVTFVAATARLDIVRTDGAEMTLGEIEAILADAVYRNDASLPTETDRVFDVCVNDGDLDSNVATSTISVARDAETAVWSITGDGTVVDGNNAAYVVALSDPLRAGETASVDLALADVDTTSADYGTLNAAVAAAVAAYSGPGSVSWDGTTLTFTSDGTGTMSGLNISLPTTPDGAYEGDEDYTISLSNPASTTGETITIAASSVTTTITDNTPPPTVTIGDGAAVEGSPVEFTIMLDLPSFESIVLDLATSSGTATAGFDFETTSFEFFDGLVWQPAVAGTQVTIPAGATSLQVRVDSVQDGFVEVDETFILGATVASGAVTSASDTGTGTIINDDVPEISIDDVSVDEDNGTLTFTISLDQPPVNAVSADWATASGTATGGVDFTSASGTANFAVGQQSQTVTIAITDDNLFEGPETLNVDLSNATGATIADAQGVGTIFDNGAGPNGTDDDRPVISIDDVIATEGTDANAIFTISLSNPSVEDVELSLALMDVSAVSPDDYGPGLEFFDGTAWQPVSGNVTIPAGTTSLQVRTPIVDDPIADSGETYSLIVTHVAGTAANTGDTGTGTILDEVVPDVTEVSITGPASVTEGDPATYTVAITNVPLTDVVVTFAYSGTATGGTDYTGVASVTIPAGSTTVAFDIATIEDTLGEPLENFTIAIDGLSGGMLEALAVSATDFEVTTDIIDDDVPAIMVSDVLVSEGADSFAVFTVELSNPTFEDIDFSIAAIGMTANGNMVDFGFVGAGDLEVFDGTSWVPVTATTIVAGDTTLLLRTPIVDDAIAEVVETFTVTVMTTGGTTSNPSDTGLGTIQEDTSDPETVLVSLTGPGSVVEGATTTDYTLSLADSMNVAINAAEDVTVTLTYSGTAADGSDFSGVLTVLIPAGSLDATFMLPTVNDSIFEGTENIVVTIDSVAGGGFEGIGADMTADEVTTLIDDAADIPTIAVTDATSVEGTDAFAVFTVGLSNLSVEDIDISLLLADGTALGAGVDFGAAGVGNLQVFDGASWVDATTATIPAGMLSVQVRTPIVDDLTDEPNEDYTLTVDVTAGTTTNIQVIGTGTIIDDDAAPNVIIDDAMATEGDPLVFNVTLSNPSSQAIVLDFAAADMTANDPGDFDGTSFEYSTDGGVTWIPAVGGTEVTIPANLTAIQVRVATTEDMTLESTETMQLSIAGVVSGFVGNTSDTGVGTIVDDDSALVSIVANDPTASEPADDGQFTVSMSNPSDSPTVIAYSVTGSATGGSDFAALAGTITIPAGQTSAMIDVTVIDDVVIEGAEDVVVMLTSITSGDPQIAIDTANDVDTVNIADDDEADWRLAGATTVNEGALATYDLILAGTLQSGESASVELSIGDNSTTNADYASFDAAVSAAVAAYAGPGSVAWDGTTLTFTSDGTGAMSSLMIDLMAVNDAVVEGVEDYTVSIAAASSSTGAAVAIDATASSVTTQIQDTIDAAGTSLDKATWSIAGTSSVNESQSTTYTVTIDAALQGGETASVDISLVDVDTVTADLSNFSADVTSAVTVYNFSGQPGSLAWDGTTLTFTSDGTGPMGDLEIQVTASADGFREGPEDYSVQLSNTASTTGACLAIDPMDSVTTTIAADAISAQWSIGVDNAGDEGDTVQYTVALTESFGAGESAAVDLVVTDVDTTSADYANFVAAVNAAVAAYAGPGTLVFDGATLTFTAAADGDAMTDLVIDLQLQDDVIVEGTETFSVALSNAAGPSGVNVSVSATDNSVTTTINDTMGISGAPDVATWSITGPAAGDEGTTATYTVSLAGALGDGESVSVVIDLNDLATTSSDYASIVTAVTAAAAANPDVVFDPATGTLTFTAPSDGATMTDVVIDLGLAADAISEGPEDFEIGLSVASSTTGAAVAIDATADLVNTTINDLTTAPQWAIAGPVSADEGSAAQYTVTLTGALGVGETATVEIDLTDLTTGASDHADINAAIAAAISANPDLAYDPASGTITFTAPTEGAMMAPIVFDLAIVNDAFAEGPENFSIGLTNPGSTTGVISTVSTTDFAVTTEINDTVDVGLGPDLAVWTLTGDTSVVEGNVAQYTVSLTGMLGAGETARANLIFADVDTNSSDYANFVAAVNTAVTGYSGPGTVAFDGTRLTFTAGSDGDEMTDLVIDLTAIDDVIVEGDEDYVVSINNANSTTGAEVLLGSTTLVTTTIIDNDVSGWSITGDSTVGEGSVAQYTVELAGTVQAGETATIDLGIADVDTMSGDYANFVAAVNAAISGRSDLSFDGTTLTYTGDGNPFPALTIDLTANDDGFIEGDEDYTVSISNPGSTTGADVTVGANSVTTTIIDNDTSTWEIFGSPTVAEGGTAQYNLFLNGTLQAGETATIDLGLTDVDTASTDYANFAGAVNAAIAGRSDLSFDGTTLTYTGDGSPFAALTIDLLAVDDGFVEDDEGYTVSISNPGSTTGGDVAAGTNSVTTTIIDDDTATWEIFGSPAVPEGGTAQYNLLLNGTLQAGQTATIDLGLADVDTTSADYANFVAAVNTAIMGRSDLSFDGTTLTYTGDGIPMTSLVIDLDTVDDTIIEGDESFAVSISNPASSTGGDISVGTSNIATTTILDNDAASWSITGDTTVDEGATAQYTVALGGTIQAGEVATIELGLADIDTSSADYANFVAAVNAAVAGRSDLAFDGATLTYTGDGTPMVDLVIDLLAVDDVITEGNEDYAVSIANPGSTTGGSFGVTSQDSVTTTIVDDDAVEWSIVGDAVVDEGGTAQYTIQLDGVLQVGENAIVELGLADLETSPADYASFVTAVQTAIGARTDLSFDAATGQLTAIGTGAAMADLVVDLDAIDDAVIEGPERYQILLSNPMSTTGAASGIDPTSNMVTTTINDTVGDGGVVEEAVWTIGVDQTVPEGSPGVYSLALSGVLQADEVVTVDLGLADIDTISGDYASFNAAMNAAAAAYAGPGSVAWDGTTFTFTSDGTGAMAPLTISLDTIDDAFAEGMEDFLISLLNANSSTGAATSIDASLDDVVTTIDDTVGAGADDVTFAIVGDTAVDEGGAAAYTVTTTGGLGAGTDATVELSIGDVDTNSSDYANFNAAVVAAVSAYNAGANPGSVGWDGTTLTFTAGADGDELTGFVIDLDAIDDAFLEGPEVYSISIANAGSTSGVVAGIDAVQNIVATTINDTDGDGGPSEPGGEWSLVGGGIVNEGDVANFTVGLTGNLQAGEVASIAISLGDIETDGSDYDVFSTAVADAVAAYNANASNSGTLAWDGINLTFTSDGSGPMNDLAIVLDTIDDTVVEGDERFNVLISSPTSTTGLTLSTSPTENLSTTTIIDNDLSEWEITGDVTVGEGASAQYVVSLSGTLQAGETSTIDLGVGDVDTASTDYANFVAAVNAAIAGRSDLAFDGTTLTYTGDGLPMADLIIDLDAIDDALVEGDESYAVSISNPGSTTGSDVGIGGSSAVTTTITDNDNAFWSIVGDTVVPEGATAQYVVALSGVLQAGETASIDLSLGDIDTSSADYINFVALVNAAVNPRPDLTFDGTTVTYTSDGSPMGDLVLNVFAVDDPIIEGDEDYTVSIANPASTTGSDIGIGGTTSVTTTITDNDLATWSITGDATVGEGASAEYTVALVGTIQAGEVATIDLGIANVNTSSSDYANFVAAVNAAVAGRPDLAFDGTTLAFTGNGSPMVDLVVNLPAVDDALVEGDEDYQVSIGNPASSTGGAIGLGADLVTTTITDDDGVTWNITGDSSVSEGAIANYVVTLDETLQAGESATIDLSLSDVDTTSSDYASFVAAVNAAIVGRSDLSFDGTTLTYTGDGNPFMALAIDLISVDDGFIEGDEDYTVSISNPGSTTGVDVAIGATSVTTTIVDDDAATWDIFGSSTVPEGGTAQYNLFLNGTLQDGETATIDLGLSDVDTTSSDYANFVAAVNAAIAGRSDLSFDGMTLTYTGDGNPFALLTIDLAAVDDGIVEGDESYSVSISNPGSTTGGDVAAGTTSATTTIVDNDTATWDIFGSSTVPEGGTAQYNLFLNGTLQSGETATIDLGLSDVDTTSSDHANFVAAVNAAILGRIDLAFDGTTLTYTGDGNPFATLTIDLDAIEDLVIEANEDYQAAISNPGSTTGGDVLLGTQTSVTTTIVDNDTAVWSITGDAAVVEGAVAQYTVSLTGTLQANEMAVIDLGIANVDTASADYVNFVAAVNAAVAGRSDLSFDGVSLTYTGDGNPMADLVIDLAAIDDVLVEGSEDYVVSILNPQSTGGDVVVSAAASVTTTIGDDDVATWSLVGDAAVIEGATASYTVSLAGTLQVGETATIDLEIADVATSSTDYANFVAAVNAAIAGRADLTFDGTTLTYTGDGNPMADLVVDLPTIDDLLGETTEQYEVSLAGPGSTTGSAVVGSGLVTTAIQDNDVVLWAISGTTAVDEGGQAQYKVSLDGTIQAGEQASVQLLASDLDSNSADYANFVTAVQAAVAGRSDLDFDATTGTLTVTGTGAPMADLCVDLLAIDDAFVEGPERFQITLSNATSPSSLVTGIDPVLSVVTTTINDTVGVGGALEQAVWSIGVDQVVAEGDPGAYVLSLSGDLQANEMVSIDLTLSDIDTTSSDYASFDAAIASAVSSYAGPGSLAWDGTVLEFTSDGSGPMTPLSISLSTIDDVIAEGTEDFLISLSNAASATGVATVIDVASDDVTTTIDDLIGAGADDVTWNLIGDTSVDEGGTASYTIGINGGFGAGEVASVDLNVANLETTGADHSSFSAAVADAVAAYAGSGSLTWDGTTLVFTATNDGDMFGGITVDLSAIDDAFLEGPERFDVSLTNSGSPTGIAVGIDPTENIVVTTINDTEGDGGPVESGAEWSVTGSLAVVEGDPATYSVALSGLLQAGEVTSVQLVLGDIETESTDYADFNLAVADAVAAYNANATNSGSLAWDGVNLTFTSDGTGPMSGLDIELGTVQDTLVEGDERLNVMLANASSSTGLTPSVSATQGVVTTAIVDNDISNWSLVGDAAVTEGATAQYTVQLGGTLQAGETATIDLSIGNVDTSSADYASFVAAVNAAVAGRSDLSFDGTTLTYTGDGNPMADLMIDLSALDDALVESAEDFTVSIFNPGSTTGSGVAVSVTNSVTTTITDNDSAVWSIAGDASVAEGDRAQYVISLAGTLQSGETSTIDLAFGDVDTDTSDYASFVAAVNAAIAGRSDLTFDGTTLTYTADGNPMLDVVIELNTIDDALIEGDESYVVSLSNPGSTTGIDALLGGSVSVATTITDNDVATWSIVGDTIVAEGTSAQYIVALNGTLQSGETATIDLGLSDIDTALSDHANFVASVNAAVAGRSDLVFDGVTLTYTGDGNPMADLIVDLPISSDGISEPPEDFLLSLSNPTGSTGLAPVIDPAADDVTTTINGSPVLQPDFGFTSINTPYLGNVLANDSDPDGDMLTVTQVNGQPIGSLIVTDFGTVVMMPDGTFTFTPNPGFFGVETFTYTVVDSAGNTEIATVEIAVNNADVGVAKAASDAVVNGENWDVTFTLVVENLGNVPLNNLTLSDDVAAMFGDAFVAVSSPTLQNFTGSGTAPTLNANWSSNTAQNILAGGVLEVGASFEVSFTVTVDPDANGASRPLGNQAEASGQGVNQDGSPMLDSNGDPAIAIDLSDDGSDPAGENGSDNNDGVFGNDATQLLIADLGIAKEVVGEPELLFSGNYVVTYQVVVENTGTVTLANLSLLEDLSTQFGSAFVEASGLSLVTGITDTDSSVFVNSAFDGELNIELLDLTNANTLVPGDSFILQFVVEIDPLAVSSPVGNQVSGSGAAVDADGNPLLDSNGTAIIGTDLSDSGDDPSGSNPNDPNDTGSSEDSTQFDPPPLPLSEITGFVFVDGNNNGIRELGEDGIGGVEITLEGTDTYGDPVFIVTTTDANGQYQFSGLNAGTYQITETQPEGFSDGSENGSIQGTLGDDQYSDIVLNWGQTLTAVTFGELSSGTSGFPPTFPSLPPINVSNIHSLIDSFLGSPSPLYAGVAIASNSNPLLLVSGRPITGGYSIDFAIEGGCPDEVEPCEVIPQDVQAVETNVEDCECECESIEVGGMIDLMPEGAFASEDTVVEEVVDCPAEVCDPGEAEADCPPAPVFLRGSFLRRMANWLQR